MPGSESIQETRSMNNWHANSKDWKPRQHHLCRVRLRTGEVVEAFYVKDINKYIRGVNRWKNVRTGKWMDDEQVVEWEEE